VIVFEVVGKIEDIETIAVGSRIRDVRRLRRVYGVGRWRKLKGFARVRLPDGSEYDAELHWYEAHVIGKKEMKVKQLLDQRYMSTVHRFAICIQNEGYPASLELWKIYRVAPDEKAARHQLVRIVDESGEDYLYPESYFVPIELPRAAEDAFLAASWS
jgi:hypothetical protein